MKKSKNNYQGRLIFTGALLYSSVWINVNNAFQFPLKEHFKSCQHTRCEANPIISVSAKPPTSQFDLDSIEDFEAELEWLSKQESAEKNCLDQDDDDDSLLFQSESEDVTTYQVPEDLHDKRIDAILFALEPALSRSQYGTLVTDGMVAISLPNENPTIITRKSLKLEQGTIIRVKNQLNDNPTEVVAQDLPLDIVYEDQDMVVINKAAGMVVHPAVGNWDGTVVNALAYYLSKKSPFGSGDFIEADGTVKTENQDENAIDGEKVFFRPGIVHRLDKGTTGLLVVAKTREALATLSEAFAARKVKKTYVAVTIGNPGKKVVIDKPIARHPIHRQRMRVVPDPTKMNSSGMTQKQRIALGLTNGKSAAQVGKNALSFVDTLAFDGKLSVAQVRIETGRTHQIRVHLQDRTTPIYGDETYGFSDWNKRLAKGHNIARPLLHAFRLELEHPTTGQRMVFKAPMATDMETIVSGIWPEGRSERIDLFEKSDIEIVA